MQFVFGDNTSKYTMLYFDDKPDAAEKAQSLVQMSYSPNPDFESVGFVPFGANNTRALFFKFCKDFKMKRNVYFLHGVYSDVEPEYFYGKNYVYGLFTHFLDQEKFDVLRDQVLAGEKPNVPYACNKALAETPYDQIDIEGADLYAILIKLYQRKNVVMVMDDDKFSNDRAMLVMKKIFYYLPPSLRKLCSFVTAVDDTGSMDFMLRIIPRSMLKLKEEHVDLDNESPLYKDKSTFTQIAASLMAMNDQERERVFELYEMLYYGRDSIYKKQNFERFYLCYTADSEDAEAVKLCDELLTDYLDNPKRAQNPQMPKFLQEALTERYSSAKVLDTLVDWNVQNLENMDQFCDINADVMRKVYYLCDPKLTYFQNKLDLMFRHTYVSRDIEKLRSFYTNTLASARAMTDVQPYEGAFLMIVADVLKYLDKIATGFRTIKEQAQLAAEEYLRQYCKNGASEPRAVLQHVLDVVGERINQLRPLVTDIDDDIQNFVLHGIVSPYNTRCNELAREKRAQRDRDMKNNIYTAFVQRLRNDSDNAEGMEADVSAEDLTREDLDLVAEDDELCQNLAQEITEYIVAVCAVRNKGDFKPDHNVNLRLVKNMKLCFQVAKNLCRKNAVDYAVLYLLAYIPRSDAAVKYILQMKELDNLDSRGLSNLKNLMPDLLKRRRNKDKLSQTELKELDGKAKEVLEDKASSKSRRVVAVMVHDMVVGGPTILERERKRNTIIGICAGVGALLLIGALVLLIVLGGNKGGDNDPTEKPGTTTAPTAPTDPSDPPVCEHTYDEGVVTTEPTCTAPGVKTFSCTECGETYTEEILALGHSYVGGVCSVCNYACVHELWIDPTCTEPKTCAECASTEGEALGHDFKNDSEEDLPNCELCGICAEHVAEEPKWSDVTNATCTAPETCNVCGTTNGDALGHDYESVVTEPTCTEGGFTTHTCKREVGKNAEGTVLICGDTLVDSQTEALGHEFEAGKCVRENCGFVCEHTWTEADCEKAKTCSVCGETEGEALGHEWSEATCQAPKTCSVCGLTEGEKLAEHTWQEASCTAPKTCSVCGETDGEALGHEGGEPTYISGSCTEEIEVEYECVKCKEKYIKTAPAPGHTLDEDGCCIVCKSHMDEEPETPADPDAPADPTDPIPE